MNPFTKKTKESKAIITAGLDSYIKYNKNNLTYPDKTYTSATLTEEYTKSILSILAYLRQTLTEEKIDTTHICPTNANPLALDVKTMTKDCPSIIVHLLYKQELPSIINILDNQHMPHIHITDETVEIAEHFELLPGLNRLLTNSRINKMFEGLNIVEARALLNQMQLLPKNNQLDTVLQNYNERKSLHYLLIKDIIENLLSTQDQYDEVRARIFLSYFDVEYKIPTPEVPKNHPKILQFKRPNCE